ncbi:hypothetical protein M407DRAFT_30614 [Tulasnella calospora MUT 4182]|uniref:Protein kinase domain-containing protein n=1 Tax=Tulasnella calospora MUT 4182 TaxID=1051891 RepID=A0A0C3KE39_9AGAM|nr:hypothetical protein M407DRAFT_30614 [Tulasnella calospora MUT 4182]
MKESINEKEEPSRSTSAQEAVIDEVEDAIQRLRISPRQVLGSLSHLRIDRARISPIEGQTPKSGGNADVEAAMLLSAPSSSAPESSDAEYVAVKKLRFEEDIDHDRTLAPLAHEVRVLNDLSHKNVVKLVGFVEEVERGVAWMVFGWEKNGNLREFISSTKWELPERLSLIDDVTGGLSYLHSRDPPICHGDLKSLNILVNSEHRGVITDFGSARTVSSVEEGAFKAVPVAKVTTTPHPTAMSLQEAEALTVEIAPSGDFITMTGPAWTVRWAAPELLRGDLPGLASDIWALGWICWEAITGHFPFEKEGEVPAIIRITKGDLPTIENDDQLKQIKALCVLMRDCWKLDTSGRPNALRCQQLISWMDHTVPSNREGSNSSVTRSTGLLFALGRVQLRNGMYSEAEGHFEQSRKVAETVGDEWGRARALYGIGDAFSLQNEYAKAEESYSRARDIYSQIGDQLGCAQSVQGLGDVYRMRNVYSKAEESYIRAQDIFSQIGDQLGFAHSAKGLGQVYQMRGEYSKAEESYIRARDIHSQIGSQLGFAGSVEGLGDIYRMRSEYSKAEESYIRARDTHSQIGNQLGFANSVLGLGHVYEIRNDVSKAEESFTLARKINSQIGHQLGIAHSVEGLGRVYRRRQEYSKAEDSFIGARDIYSQVGNQLGIAQSIESLGFLYRIRSEFSKAEESYIRARDIYSQIGSQRGVADSSEGIGRVYSAQGAYEVAEESFLEAEQIYRRIGNMRGLADISLHLGMMRFQQAQYAAAERLFCEASTLFGELGLQQGLELCNQAVEVAFAGSLAPTTGSFSIAIPP